MSRRYIPALRLIALLMDRSMWAGMGFIVLAVLVQEWVAMGILAGGCILALVMSTNATLLADALELWEDE